MVRVFSPSDPWLFLMTWDALSTLPHFYPEAQTLGRRQIEASFLGNSRALLLKVQLHY